MKSKLKRFTRYFMDKILTQCEKCNGKGEITKTNKQNYGIWGMGFANLVDYLASVSWKETCDKCDGKGVYYIDKNKIKKY